MCTIPLRKLYNFRKRKIHIAYHRTSNGFHTRIENQLKGSPFLLLLIEGFWQTKCHYPWMRAVFFSFPIGQNQFQQFQENFVIHVVTIVLETFCPRQHDFICHSNNIIWFVEICFVVDWHQRVNPSLSLPSSDLRVGLNF